MGILVLILSTASPETASAYIDPTSGGLLLQFLLGGLAGVAVVIKLTWHRFKDLFTRGRQRDQSDRNQESDGE
jgi:hypothetical protein